MEDYKNKYEQILKDFFKQKLRIDDVERELEEGYLSILKPNSNSINKYLYIGNDININEVQINDINDIHTSYIEQTYSKVLFKKLKKGNKYYFLPSKNRDPHYDNIVNDYTIVFVLDCIYDYKVDARERAKMFVNLRRYISNLEEKFCNILNNDVRIFINEIYVY